MLFGNDHATKQMQRDMEQIGSRFRRVLFLDLFLRTNARYQVAGVSNQASTFV